jgi:hypothetical protein
MAGVLAGARQISISRALCLLTSRLPMSQYVGCLGTVACCLTGPLAAADRTGAPIRAAAGALHRAVPRRTVGRSGWMPQTGKADGSASRITERFVGEPVVHT